MFSHSLWVSAAVQFSQFSRFVTSTLVIWICMPTKQAKSTRRQDCLATAIGWCKSWLNSPFGKWITHIHHLEQLSQLVNAVVLIHFPSKLRLKFFQRLCGIVCSFITLNLISSFFFYWTVGPLRVYSESGPTTQNLPTTVLGFLHFLKCPNGYLSIYFLLNGTEFTLYLLI